MLFNKEKSEAIHFGANDKEVDHFLGSSKFCLVENTCIGIWISLIKP